MLWSGKDGGPVGLRQSQGASVMVIFVPQKQPDVEFCGEMADMGNKNIWWVRVPLRKLDFRQNKEVSEERFAVWTYALGLLQLSTQFLILHQSDVALHEAQHSFTNAHQRFRMLVYLCLNYEKFTVQYLMQYFIPLIISATN